MSKEVREEFAKGAGIERVFFPDKPGEVTDWAVLMLAAMGPDRSLAEPDAVAHRLDVARARTQSDRVFKSAVVWSVADDWGGNMRAEARKLLAWI